jgi:hypothetical protein
MKLQISFIEIQIFVILAFFVFQFSDQPDLLNQYLVLGTIIFKNIQEAAINKQIGQFVGGNNTVYTNFNTNCSTYTFIY